MRVLLQRVRTASVAVDDRVVAQIGAGLLALVGIGPDDSTIHLERMAAKILDLRIFEDTNGKMNLSLREMTTTFPGQYGILLVSQFTLYADTQKGRRPSFVNAAPPERANELIAEFGEQLRDQGITVASGQFGAHMVVALENDGPVTIWLDSAVFHSA